MSQFVANIRTLWEEEARDGEETVRFGICLNIREMMHGRDFFLYLQTSEDHGKIPLRDASRRNRKENVRSMLM